MCYFEIYSADDGLSYFRPCHFPSGSMEPLGIYSNLISVSAMQVREFQGGLLFDWHTAPEKQFIIYLAGRVQVIASSGEEHIFETGDILLANDLSGRGHITKTLTSGQSVIVKC